MTSEALFQNLEAGKPVIAPRDIPPTPQIQKANISDFAVLT
ncbi:hypothetical protein [Candidatus Liberibacter solanacearum]|nr:hypothetical protein [Candidatus Liberibacter solanacearum]